MYGVSDIFSFIVATVIMLVPAFVVGGVFENESVLERLIKGFIVSLAEMQLVGVPCVFLKTSFSTIVILYVTLMVITAVYAIYRDIRNKTYLDYHVNILSLETYSAIDIMIIPIIFLVFKQIAQAVNGQFFVFADNNVYIPYINDIVETGKIYPFNYETGNEVEISEVSSKYKFTSYFPYLAMICKGSGMHATVLTQTFLYIVYILMFYVVMWIFSSVLFKKRSGRWMFVFFVAVLVEMTCGMDFTFANHVIANPYMGKKILFTIFIPFMWFLICKMYKLCEKETENTTWYKIVELAVMSFGGCCVSLMAGGLVPMVYITLGVIISFKNKSFKPFTQMLLASIPALVLSIVVIICKMKGMS